MLKECVKCGVIIEAKGANKYCEDCRKEVVKERQKKAFANKTPEQIEAKRAWDREWRKQGMRYYICHSCFMAEKRVKEDYCLFCKRSMKHGACSAFVIYSRKNKIYMYCYTRKQAEQARKEFPELFKGARIKQVTVATNINLEKIAGKGYRIIKPRIDIDYRVGFYDKNYNKVELSDKTSKA